MYNIPQFTLVECKNTTQNGNKCASREEIEEFVNDVQVLTLIAKTLPYEDIFEENATFFVDE